MSKALARRLSHGDITIVRQPDGASHVEYDHIEVCLVGGRLCISLMAGEVELASMDAAADDLFPSLKTLGKTISFDNLTGRLPLSQFEEEAYRYAPPRP